MHDARTLVWARDYDVCRRSARALPLLIAFVINCICMRFIIADSAVGNAFNTSSVIILCVMKAGEGSLRMRLAREHYMTTQDDYGIQV